MQDRIRFPDCIFCGNPNGSREHTTLAALGGLHEDRGILCETCNNGFSQLDDALARDLRPLNGMIGAHHGRTGDALAAKVRDPTSGRVLQIHGRRVAHPDVAILKDVDGTLHALCSTQAQVDQLVARLRAEGKKVKVTSRERVPAFFAEPLRLDWHFGGPETLRAVARLALNVLAHHFPALVREPWLDDFKAFLKNGGDIQRWVWYEFADVDPREPVEAFAFSNRFVLGFDTDRVYARVRLLGVIEIAVFFGTRRVNHESSLIHDVDVLAAHRPTDIHVQRLEGVALYPPTKPTEDPAPYVTDRLATLIAKQAERQWDEEAPDLVNRLNATRETQPAKRHDLIVEALQSQKQRILNLAVRVGRDMREHLGKIGPGGESIGDAMLLLVQPDGASRTGVTELAEVNIGMMIFALADHLYALLPQKEITLRELRLLLEGGRGAAIIGRYLYEQIRSAHPLLREDDSSAT